MSPFNPLAVASYSALNQASDNNDYANETDDVTEGSGSGWILVTVIVASIILTIITIVILYDLYKRCRQLREHTVYDGGAPASPGHQHSYTFSIKVDEASKLFNRKTSTIMLDLLDNNNHFLTRLAIPSKAFKFNTATRTTSTSPSIRKSVNKLVDWNLFKRTDTVTFYLLRRNPLKNFNSIRIMHDCYDCDAQITFKYIIIRDDNNKQSSRVNLANQPIRAIHPCPPSGMQVFQAVRIA